MNKKIIIAILISLTLFLFGCTDGGTAGTQISLQPFIGGNTGVTVEFEPNAPPVETFDGGYSPFDVSVKLENKGEYKVDAQDIEVVISGIRAQEFNLKDEDLIKKPSEELSAMIKDPTGKIIPSGPVFVEFPEFNHVSYITGSQTSYTIRADLCYAYGTKAISKLCVRKNLLTPEEGGLCTLSEDKPVFNSGAPVHVTSLSESSRSKDKLSFTFDVGHVGTGDIFEKGSNCDVSLKRYEDRVSVRVETKLDGLSCSGLSATGNGVVEGFVSLYGGSRTVTCTQQITNRNDYETAINIELQYDYEEIKDTTLVLKSSGEDL